MDNQYWYEEQKQQHFSDADKRRGGKRVSAATLIVCMLITGILGGALGGQIVKSAPDAVLSAQATPAPTANQTAGVPEEASKPVAGLTTQAAADGVYTKAQIVELAAPSIVGIDVEGTRTDWYGRSEVTTGSGSGVIISADGYIITNNHVIDGANGIKVYLSDDTEYSATLIGSDQKTDLAVIKIEAAGLTPVSMGDSDTLVVGEDVVAIGNPLGELRGTATSGMVSALSRTITIDSQEMTLLQTDAAINPGNSGGGLFNARGQLIGIINAKVASSATEGLGFAIPVNDAKAVIEDLIDLGYVSGRAYLGVYTQNVAVQPERTNGQGGDLFGIFEFGSGQNVETRVQVAEIVKGSAAENAGIQAGDLILAVDGKEISTGSELATAISEYKAGDTATIEVQRSGGGLTLTVTFGEYVPE
ncbi:MAG TPA: trypsin-like peptidase domain-containing protein [Feifaniaceae bacterium]|nr:trypsin-like peptidase domain-containing protein [Feifaniaceae bacterium]